MTADEIRAKDLTGIGNTCGDRIVLIAALEMLQELTAQVAELTQAIKEKQLTATVHSHTNVYGGDIGAGLP